MFGVGGQELVLLMVIGLIVLGPERLPRIASQIGGWLGQARRMTRVMKRQLEEELDVTRTPTIKPPPASRAPSEQPPREPEYEPPRDDDDYSPAHAENEVGTGVDSDIYDDESDLAVTEAARQSSAADVPEGETVESTKEKEPDEKPAT